MKRATREAVLPLTPLQEGMLFHSLYEKDGVDPYVIQLALTLEGPLSPKLLRAAVEALVGRHDILRVGFHQRSSGQAVQIVNRITEVPWTELDLSEFCAAERQERLGLYRAKDRATRFDMARAPLLRFCLVKLTAEHHALLMTYHHILLDAWSFQLVMEELFLLYEWKADSSGLSEVVPFRRYLAWLVNQDRQAAEAAWTKSLAGLPGPTLVSGGIQVGQPASFPKLRITKLSMEFTAALTEAARAAALTLNTMIHGAWALLLCSLTGQQDVVFGQTVSGRASDMDGIEEIVGPLINAAPVRVRLDPQESCAAMLARIQQEQLDVIPYHHLGLADIQRCTGVNELYDTSTAFVDGSLDSNSVPEPADGLRVRISAAEEQGQEGTGSTHYPLSLTATAGQTLELALSYRDALFDDMEIGRLAERLSSFLETFVSAPHTLVGHIGLLARDELARVVSEWNETEHEVPDLTLPDLFEQQCSRTPNAAAVVFDGVVVSYAEFGRKVHNLAAVLRAKGVKAGDFVAVAIPRSVELVVALHAVIAAGGAYVPIDPEYPPSRIDVIVHDSNPKLLLTSTSVEGRFPEGISRLLVDKPLPAVVDDKITAVISGESPAYVIFTSGSTGRPKGVMVPQSAIVNRLLWMQDQYPLASGDRVLQKTPAGFDVSVWEFFWPLQTGAALVIARPEGHKDAAYLADLIRRESVTTVHFVPSMLNAFLLEPTAGLCDSLRQVFSSGEALAVEAQDRFFACLNASLHNLYGPTEAAVDVTAWSCRRDHDTAVVPIGRPVWNTQAYVLDTALRPVAPGVPGELYLAGRQLASGYVERPALTAERFVANPFHGAGERMYRTGDVARWTAGGDLEYLGRTDDQIKIRGLRVELGEIETVLTQHHAVVQAAVVARKEQSGASRLVAYAVLNTVNVNPDELLAFAAASLPEYMVPTALVLLPELPLTPNGKLDRSVLPAPGANRKAAGRPPRGRVEEQIAGLFADVLGLAEVTAEDSFFELGGDSIISIHLVARARRAGLIFTPKDVFVHRTVAALARVSRPEQSEAAREALDTGVGEVPLTPIMHWLSQLQGPVDDFHQAVLLRVPADLDMPRLTLAVQAVLDRHDALRMRRRAGTNPSDWTLDIALPGTVQATDCLERVDATGLGSASLSARIRAEAVRAQVKLAPDRRQLLQSVWFDAGPDASGRLLILVHHLAVDAVSWPILVSDLKEAWDAVSHGAPARLSPVPASVRTWSQALAAAAVEPGRADELSQWTAMMLSADAPLSIRPLDPGRDVYGTARSLSFQLGPEYTDPLLTDVPTAYRAGVDEVLLTALALAIGAWRRERTGFDGTDVLLDVEGHGREETIGAELDLSRTVGWFTSLYPVRIDPGDTGVGSALKRVKEQLRALGDHGIGYGLLRYLNPRTSPLLASLPTPQIGFNYLGRSIEAGSGDWQVAAEADALEPMANSLLTMPHVLECTAMTQVLPDGPHLHMQLTWPGELLDTNAVRQLGEAWLASLRTLAGQAAQPEPWRLTPSDVLPAKLTQAELEHLEAAWQVPGLSDVLPLTCIQEGLLFHSSYDREAPDVYHVQVGVDFEGGLDGRALRAACQALVDRHPGLRVVFAQTRAGTPIQLVLRGTRIAWEEHDLTGDTQGEHLASFLAEDYIRRFDLEQAPPLRFSLLRMTDTRHKLVITLHHILADGWSTGLMLRDLGELFARDCDTVSLPDPEPIRPYYQWLAEQDATVAEAAWKSALSDLPEPTLLVPGADAAGLPTIPRQLNTRLSRDLTTALISQARACELTTNTVLQGAWALLLAELTGREDVVFGATVSVRPPELPGAAEMVGLQINTIPVRVRLGGGTTLAELLGHLQGEQAELAPHAYFGLSCIQRLTGVGTLFDTSMVFQNYPRQEMDAVDSNTSARIVGFSGRDAYHHPLKLTAAPGDLLYLELSYRPELISAGEAEAALERLQEILADFAANPHRPVMTHQAAHLCDPAVAEVVACLAADVLGLEEIGIKADFFTSGGDSLSALRLVGRLRDRFGSALDVSTVFQRRTAERIAAKFASPPCGRQL